MHLFSSFLSSLSLWAKNHHCALVAIMVADPAAFIIYYRVAAATTADTRVESTIFSLLLLIHRVLVHKTASIISSTSHRTLQAYADTSDDAAFPPSLHVTSRSQLSQHTYPRARPWLGCASACCPPRSRPDPRACSGSCAVLGLRTPVCRERCLGGWTHGHAIGYSHRKNLQEDACERDVKNGQAKQTAHCVSERVVIDAVKVKHLLAVDEAAQLLLEVNQ